MNELNYIIEHMSKITLDEFKDQVDPEDFRQLQESFGYTDNFPIHNDWHVTYHKCWLPKKHKTAYILIHSCIEYVFYV